MSEAEKPIHPTHSKSYSRRFCGFDGITTGNSEGLSTRLISGDLGLEPITEFSNV